MLRVAPSARVLSALLPADLVTAAEIVLDGGVVALPFNGVYAVFGPSQQQAWVTPPQHFHELVDPSRLAHPREAVHALLHELHALGVILPARSRGTTLVAWTEYVPLRSVFDHLARFGPRRVRADILPYSSVRDVFSNLFTRVDAIIADDFSQLPPQRRQPPTVVDLTGAQPRLHRLGSVRVLELQAALSRHGFETLRIGPSHLPGH